MDLKSLSFEELQEEFAILGEPKFRVSQVYDWMHKKCVSDIDEMTNLSKALREKLKEKYEFTSLRMARMQESEIDGTRKFLFELSDGNFIESVWMKYHHGNSVCISSQVGCRMGCKFCASTLDGLERNLLPGEMLDQIYRISQITGERVSNIVVMGSGEPMDNYDNVLKFLKIISDERGLCISQRNITVSTCGIVPGIRKLAEEKLQITLAISLHAPTDEKRKALMPIANSYSLAEVMDACRFYFDKTGRRISFEYALVKGVNDREEEVAELTSLLKGMNCHINLIPVNPIKERDYRSTDRTNVLNFQNKLEKNGINVTIRREMGRDIDGACGQLRRRHMEEV
ncbi:MAG: 23S rRNA (adenine(2503)-C(2))-methyltransferase RlmN [Lachnospiraceae bacterium]|nr:23S rRNA (adenine(2503)-C(2))-methyltransferase RlmN [Lachnospiraceae bacterium]